MNYNIDGNIHGVVRESYRTGEGHTCRVVVVVVVLLMVGVELVVVLYGNSTERVTDSEGQFQANN